MYSFDVKCMYIHCNCIVINELWDLSLAVKKQRLIKCKHAIFQAAQSLILPTHYSFTGNELFSSWKGHFVQKTSWSDKPLGDFANLPTYLTSMFTVVTTSSTKNFCILYAPRLTSCLCLLCYLLVSNFAEVL